MADLIVTFGRAASTGSQYVPLEQAGARTEVLVMAGGTETPEEGTLLCQRYEDVVTLYAAADCWVSIGSPNNNALDPSDATIGSNRRFIPEGRQVQFAVKVGDAVSVIEY